MTDQATKERKPRQKLGQIELYSQEGNQLTRLDIPIPQDLKSADAMERWLKKTAEVDGEYIFLRRIVGVQFSKRPTVEVVTKRI